MTQNERLLEVLRRGPWVVEHPDREAVLDRVAQFPDPDVSLQHRWLAKVDVTDSCWVWTGAKHHHGHGSIALTRSRGTAYAHRLSYEWFVGSIPSHLEIDHVCRNPSCVNPTHLEAVTHAENVRRGDVRLIFGSRTHCNYGHPFEGDNVRARSDCNGRVCKTCANEASRRHRARLGQEERRARWRAQYHRRKALLSEPTSFRATRENVAAEAEVHDVGSLSSDRFDGPVRGRTRLPLPSIVPAVPTPAAGTQLSIEVAA